MNQISEQPQECDIVMKGGVTSGVVYPSAIVELSKSYRFRNIGGTSAGAIAATLTAAAEYGRQTNGGTAFQGLAGLPQWLWTDKHLLGLFKANRATAPLFGCLMKLMSVPAGKSKFLPGVGAVLWAYPWISGLGAIIGLALATIGVLTGQSWLIGFAVPFILFLPFVFAGFALYGCVTKNVPGNFYGMCSGLKDGAPDDDETLTSWLARKLDSVAGVDKRPDKPLTFGDLWSAGAANFNAAAAPRRPKDQDANQRDDELEARSINLEMITSSLSHGRPYRFPFETSIFYFDPTELGKLFPSRIVNWMKTNARKPGASDSVHDKEERARMSSALPLLPLPEARDIPIVVAARMSLSFPFLLSAVPLRAVDWNVPNNDKNPTAPKFEQCWFSDGGLSSNFPIQLFDGPIPSRPTFAIDLDQFPEGFDESDKDECANVWMPQNNRQGTHDSWTRFDRNGPNLFGFVSAIVNVLQNWHDNVQSLAPGYRDRIVHVYLKDNEGGLNLNMSEDLLKKLSARGQCAGEMLVDHFAAPNPPDCENQVPQPTNWDNHRVVRYRTAMALLENWIRRLRRGYTPDYATLMGRAEREPPCSYAWDFPNQSDFAANAIKDIIALNDAWVASQQSFADGAPKPQPELAARPRL